MFINEIISKPVYLEGRRFVERTINSKFNRGDATITTTYMDGKPLLKQYIFSGHNYLKNVWKEVKTNKTSATVLDNNLNVLG